MERYFNLRTPIRDDGNDGDTFWKINEEYSQLFLPSCHIFDSRFICHVLLFKCRKNSEYEAS